MNILVVYDSCFGNTQQIAEAIHIATARVHHSVLLKVKDVDAGKLKNTDLLIIGSPTRGFRPSEDTTAFLRSIPANGLKQIKTAAFDTRIQLDTIKSSTLRLIVKTGGYAAKSIARQLRKKGGEAVSEPMGFFVSGEQGPLAENETGHAVEWAERVAGNTGK
ncbi:MAG: flavodoxin family protein [Bacteroidota bacterium]